MAGEATVEVIPLGVAGQQIYPFRVLAVGIIAKRTVQNYSPSFKFLAVAINSISSPAQGLNLKRICSISQKVAPPISKKKWRDGSF